MAPAGEAPIIIDGDDEDDPPAVMDILDGVDDFSLVVVFFNDLPLDISLKNDDPPDGAADVVVAAAGAADEELFDSDGLEDEDEALGGLSKPDGSMPSLFMA